MKRLNLKEKLTYSIGQLGISFVTSIHMLYLVYFFFPPKDAGLPEVIQQGAVFGGLTLLGLAMGAGRLLDALTDPLVAGWSDNFRHPKGSRTVFMRRSALGFALTYVLVFFVPVPGSIHPMNEVWLVGLLLISAIFLTLYIIPYFALMVEIAPHPDDKVDMTTFNSALWFTGFLIVSFSAGLWDPFASLVGGNTMDGMRMTFLALGGLGFIFLLIPALFVKEDAESCNKKDSPNVNQKLLFQSIGKVFKNKDYRNLVAWNTLYTIATYMFETGLVYFITVLARMDATAQGPLTVAIGAITFASYPFVNYFAKKRGKKNMMILGFILFALMFTSISVLGLWGLPIWLVMGLVVIFAPIPQSIFQMLPQAMSADCAAWDAWKTGEDNAGMYFAVGGFVTKLGASLATILFTSLLLFGKDIGDDLGIRLTTILGAVLCIAGLLVLLRYNEKRILSYSKEIKNNESNMDAGDSDMGLTAQESV
ncbi:MAG: MFS transporter [Spirochaetales bacterium]|nr:MFS transporter [Spirochaetales bacterium]